MTDHIYSPKLTIQTLIFRFQIVVGEKDKARLAFIAMFRSFIYSNSFKLPYKLVYMEFRLIPRILEDLVNSKLLVTALIEESRVSAK